jgi:hypothetical protein
MPVAYCVKCGVELERDLTSCPLCSTPVYFPEDMAEGAQKRYPERVQRAQPKHVNLVPSKAFVYLMTFILIIPIIVCLMIDIRGNSTITWSFYPAASLLLIWILMAYPALMRRYSFIKVITIDIYAIIGFLVSLDVYSGGFLSWCVYPVASLLLIWVYFLLFFLFSHKNPVFIVIIGYISTALFLYLIEQATETRWFFELAIPVLTLLSVLAAIVVVLSRFIRGTGISGLIFSALSLFCIGAEIFVNRFVFHEVTLFWSLIVAGVFIPVSIFLFFVQSNEEFRIYLQKKFHF